YTETFSEVTDTGFVQRQQIGGGSGDVHVERRWGCGAAGLGSEDYTDISVSQSNFKFKSLAHQGVLVPPPADWKQGGVWDYSYDVSGEGQMPGSGNRSGAPSIETKGTIKVRNEIVAQEQVNVPAGNFGAWKVQSTITQNLQTKMGNMNVPTNVALKMDSWYAKDVGLIKSEIKDFGATTELVSFAK
ncbi:MAG TPA: hypothetical protein VM870_07595, partial [Pyrinomonadaceae bacterium]|nr:hypothetical protein [Pyrinomonadaceae bacterium]